MRRRERAREERRGMVAYVILPTRSDACRETLLDYHVGLDV